MWFTESSRAPGPGREKLTIRRTGQPTTLSGLRSRAIPGGRMRRSADPPSLRIDWVRYQWKHGEFESGLSLARRLEQLWTNHLGPNTPKRCICNSRLVICCGPRAVSTKHATWTPTFWIGSEPAPLVRKSSEVLREGMLTAWCDPGPRRLRRRRRLSRGFIRRAEAVPRCGGVRGWRSRAGTVPVPCR